MTTQKITAEALAGPWQTVIADRLGFVYDSVDDARENAEDPDEELTITVVRGTAAPNDRNGTTGCRLRLPGSNHCGDKAYELDDVYLDDEDVTIGADARYAQAQAMAAGLNAATVEVSRTVPDDTVRILVGEHFTRVDRDGKTVAVTWAAGDACYVAAAGGEPERFDSESVAMVALMVAAGLNVADRAAAEEVPTP